MNFSFNRHLAWFFAVGVAIGSAGCASNSRDALGRCPPAVVEVGCPFGEERKCATNTDGCQTCGCEPRPGAFGRPDPATPPMGSPLRR